MSKDDKEPGVKVTAMRDHTYAGKAYKIGDTYTVQGDAFTTQEQYLASLKAAGLAKVDGDVWPQTLEEAEAAAAKSRQKPEGATAVAPLTTENFVADEPPVSEPAKDTKATTEQRKPATSGKK